MHATIDLEHDELLTLGQACRLLPRKPSPPTLWRWRTKGVWIAGQRIRLECVRFGGRWFTTSEAMSEFVAKQSQMPTVDEEPTAQRSASTTKKLREADLL